MLVNGAGARDASACGRRGVRGASSRSMASTSRMHVFGFAGYSGSGKTTLIEQLIPRLVGRGLRVVADQARAPPFDIDKPGKDSWRHREAGATRC